METIKELWFFMRVRKKFWLAPIIIALLMLALLFAAAMHLGPLSPFMYAL